MRDRVWKVFVVELLLIIIFATVYNSKSTLAKETVLINEYGFSITAQQSSGTTTIKFSSDGRCRFYDFSGKIRVISEKKLTHRMLRKRRNKVLYVEKIIGRVVNNKLDGRTSNGNYISYRSLRGKVRKGSKVVTYFIYSPYTTWTDDIDERYDTIIRR